MVHEFVDRDDVFALAVASIAFFCKDSPFFVSPRIPHSLSLIVLHINVDVPEPVVPSRNRR